VGLNAKTVMKIADISPYWGDVHQDLLDLLDRVSDDLLLIRPAERSLSIQQMVLEIVHEQRFHVSMLMAKNQYVREHPRDYTSRESLRELLIATWELIDYLIEPLTDAGLRAVRTLPADPQNNRPETNVTFAWLLWHALHQEIFYTGQISVRLRDYQPPRNPWD